MKILLSLVCAATALLASAVGTGSATEPEWLDDIDEALALAAETDRPVLLVFR